MTSQQIIRDGHYILAPEGSAWIGLAIRDGRIASVCEQAVQATFRAAGDDRADLAPEDDMAEVGVAEAAAIVAMWDEQMAPECVLVYRQAD